MAEWIKILADAPIGALLITAGLALVAVYIGFSGLRRTRLIEDVPTARVRSAPQGYVELVGTARMLDGEPIVAPLSQTACCWYRYRVEERAGKDWRTVQSGTSDSIFLLRDATGDCIIDPEGAEVTTGHTQTWSDDGSGWGGHAVHARLPSLGRRTDLFVKWVGRLLSGLGSGVGRFRYTEAVILDGDPLFAVGRFHTLGTGDQVSTLRELTAAVLREWKQRPDTLRERFDLNRDGKIDQLEWERARRVAARQAADERVEQFARDQLHTLRSPSDGRHFLLSNLQEFDLLRRYRWRMRLGFGFFLMLGSVAALMLSTKV